MNLAKYNKAIAACIPAVVGVLALIGVNASDTVDVIAKALIALGPVIVYFWPANRDA